MDSKNLKAEVAPVDDQESLLYNKKIKNAKDKVDGSKEKLKEMNEWMTDDLGKLLIIGNPFIHNQYRATFLTLTLDLRSTPFQVSKMN